MLHRSEAVSGRRTLTFRLPPDHTGVSVVGTFNGWVPGLLTLQPGPDGWLEAHVDVPADEQVRFRYLGSSGWWFDELDADRIDNQGSIVEPAAEEQGSAGEPEASGAEAVPRRILSPAEVAGAKEAKLRRKRARAARAALRRAREIGRGNGRG